MESTLLERDSITPVRRSRLSGDGCFNVVGSSESWGVTFVIDSIGVGSSTKGWNGFWVLDASKYDREGTDAVLLEDVCLVVLPIGVKYKRRGWISDA